MESCGIMVLWTKVVTQPQDHGPMHQGGHGKVEVLFGAMPALCSNTPGAFGLLSHLSSSRMGTMVEQLG